MCRTPWVRIPLVILAALAANPVFSQPDGPVGRKYALLVGIRDYSLSEGELGDLKYTEKDVEVLATFLEQQGGYRRVVILTQSRGNSKRELDPTAGNIDRHLSALLRDTRKGDTVLVALSGHGVLGERGREDESFFCPMDARPKKQTNLVALADIFGRLEKCPADVRLLLVDACRNDPRGKGAMAGTFVPIEPPRGIAALYSCRKGQKAQESDELKHGVFFHYVLEGLRGKAANRKGEVTLASLGEYVTDEVPNHVKKEFSALTDQTPHLVGDVSGKVILVSGREVLQGAPRTSDTTIRISRAYVPSDPAFTIRADDVLQRILKDGANEAVDLYNAKKHNGSYRRFQGIVVTCRCLLKDHPELRKALDAALEDAKKAETAWQSARKIRAQCDELRLALHQFAQKHKMPDTAFQIDVNTAIQDVLKDGVNLGAELYNAADYEGSAEFFYGMTQSLRDLFRGHEKLAKALTDALTEANGLEVSWQRARALRAVLDQLRLALHEARQK